MVARDMMTDCQSVAPRGKRPLEGGLGEVVSLIMPLRSGRWYAMVQDDALQGRVDMMFGKRESAEAWVLDVLSGVAMERARHGQQLIEIEMAWEEASVVQ